MGPLVFTMIMAPRVLAFSGAKAHKKGRDITLLDSQESSEIFVDTMPNFGMIEYIILGTAV